MKTTDEYLNEHAKKAMHLIRLNIPYLAELTDKIELVPTSRIETAGIFESGRMIFNPTWLNSLHLREAAFVIAHEIIHLALKTHHRIGIYDQQLFNITHDFIINEFLKETLKLHETPANGLDWEKDYSRYHSIKNKPAEELFKFIQDVLKEDGFNRDIFRIHWDASHASPLNKHYSILGEKFNNLIPNQSSDLENSQIIKIKTDVLSDALEKELFPNLTREKISAQKIKMQKLLSKALSTKLFMERNNIFIGNQTNNESNEYEAIKALYTPPWQTALQNWIEFTTRSGQTYSRTTRRGNYDDVIRPGYKREGNTLHIIIDTSGSMEDILGEILGTIATFCENLMIPEIHIVQCDVSVSDDNWFTPEELFHFTVKGLGGSDLTPAMLKLAEDSQVENVIIITDGMIDFPSEPMPYEILWVITEGFGEFSPGYGVVIEL